jgi:CBS domain-containing protein
MAKTKKKELKVRDVMTKDPVVAKLPGTRTEVLRLLVTSKVTGLPVVKPDGSMAGFVARKHIFERPDEEQLALIIQKDWPTAMQNDSVPASARLMVEKDLHHLPVVSKGKPVGIVTPTDLLSVVEDLKLDTPVDELARSPCVPVYEMTPLTVASEIIKIANVFALPVLDDNAHLSGILTDRDIFGKTEIDGSIAISDLGLGQDEDAWTWEGLRNVMKLYYEESRVTLPDIPVKEVMVPNPVTVFRKTGVSEAARLMRRNDFGQLPIRDAQDRLYSMLYELDVISVLAE